jgi:hypothetical protein
VRLYHGHHLYHGHYLYHLFPLSSRMVGNLFLYHVHQLYHVLYHRGLVGDSFFNLNFFVLIFLF